MSKAEFFKKCLTSIEIENPKLFGLLMIYQINEIDKKEKTDEECKLEIRLVNVLRIIGMDPEDADVTALDELIADYHIYESKRSHTIISSEIGNPPPNAPSHDWKRLCTYFDDYIVGSRSPIYFILPNLAIYMKDGDFEKLTKFIQKSAIRVERRRLIERLVDLDEVSGFGSIRTIGMYCCQHGRLPLQEIRPTLDTIDMKWNPRNPSPS